MGAGHSSELFSQSFEDFCDLLAAAGFLIFVVGKVGGLDKRLGPLTNFLDSFWHDLSNTRLLNIPRFFVIKSIRFLNSSVVALSFFMLFLFVSTFWLVHCVRWVYEINGNQSDFQALLPVLQHFRDRVVWLLVASVAFAVFGGAVSQNARFGGIGLVVGGLMAFILGIWLQFTVVPFAWTYYPQILNAALSTTPRDAILSQAFLLPLNTLVFGLPSFLIATLFGWLFRPFWQPVVLIDQEGDLPADAVSNAIAQRISMGFSAGVTGSFILTALSIALGKLLDPQAHFAMDAQMFITNAILDGITLLVTITLLVWSVIGEGAWWKIWAAVAATLLFAVACGILSLYLGTIGTSDALSIRHVINVMLGYSADGTRFSFGPAFWVMHTTFVPILFFWIIMFLSVVGKLILLPIFRFVTDPNTPTPLSKWGLAFMTLGAGLAALELVMLHHYAGFAHPLVSVLG